MDKVSFIVETLANINQSILLIYFLCGTLNVNKKINSKIAVISGVSIIFAYLEIQYMVVPFEGLGVGILWAMLVIYACLFMDGNIFQKMYASMFIIATIIFVTVLLGSIMGALYNVHFIEFTGTASMEKCLLVILIQITIWIVAVILVRILRRYSYGVNIKDTVIIMAAMIMSVIITNEVQMMSTDSDAEKMIVRSIIIMICVTIMFILCVALYEIIQRSTYALMEQTIMEQAYKSRLENVEDIEMNVERISRIKHELNKTLIAANLMLKDGRTEEAREFLSQFDGDLDKIIVEKMYTNNIIINEFLTKKSKDCRQKNIDFVAVVNGELKLIKNVDIFCVLSNLLDNAIEAQTFVDNKRVEVFIDENEDVCSLKIYNSISDDMVKAFKEDTLFKTHKKDKLMHGYGLKNVNDVVKKYNGRINYSIIGTCVLCCSVILYREK